MKINNRVAWHEGLFVRQHHFQQMHRHLDWLLDQRVAPLAGDGWGLTMLAVDRGALERGHVALARAEGLMRDGTPIAMPEEAALPPSIEIPKATRDCLVHLALPRIHPADADMARGTGLPANGKWHRYVRHSEPLPDRVDGGPPELVDLAYPQFRLLLDSEARDDLVCLPVARIAETHPQRGVLLDESFIPPVLSVSASGVLYGYLSELAGMIDQRISRLAETASMESLATSDHLLLWGLNRHRGVFHHLTDLGRLHPQDLYREMLRLAGELATLFVPGRTATRFPTYRHDDLTASFRPVYDELRRSLSIDLARSTEKLALGFDRDRMIWVCAPLDPAHLDGWRFILSCKTTASAADLHKFMKANALISSKEGVAELRRGRDGGADLLLQPVVPARINERAGRVFLEIDRKGTDWDAIRRDRSLAVYIMGGDAGADLQLWAAREDEA
ncbi:type VI secretion system baseplate subunit TssK [Niveispirillum sp. KHB5.9]|uniref:type VI secretion system baseplate subunit TssK n=1 Tax=Niveispirillum sp. KHB5.9 TaxID=3400269 RepID=UPI003A8B7D3B